MTQTYTAVFVESDGWIVGWTEEEPGAIAQERTIEEARESLKKALKLLHEDRQQDEDVHIIARETLMVSYEAA